MSLIQSKRMVKTEVHKVLERNLEKELEKLDCQFHMLRCLLSQSLSNGVEKSKSSCQDDAEEKISPYLPQGNRGFHKILQALCKNGGRHRSKGWHTVLDLNECLTKHMYENIDAEFNLIFSVNAKTGISVQELIDKFSIINCDTAQPAPPMLNHTEDFIQAQELKQKKKLKEEVVIRKKTIYTSIQTTIKTAMTSCYEEAAEYKGDGSLKRKQKKLLDDIESFKCNMFDNAKQEVLRQSDQLMGDIKEGLKSEIKTSIQHSFAQASNITLLDVSSEIKALEKLSTQL
ncbi:nuclear GTPase SLIP-GC-like [Sinocyclocheilus anshuiensis]|uniref:nuclear GTPase SLIP-GC-like n=1 Tax=Sinocyclocheilus anshuiensis TaxID=1608454 RepID=UPI0007B9293C|nr:PREDICTED: nuclear GTPase SLIP-GC-like [Sinocyclocheilus anshuiensis]